MLDWYLILSLGDFSKKAKQIETKWLRKTIVSVCNKGHRCSHLDSNTVSTLCFTPIGCYTPLCHLTETNRLVFLRSFKKFLSGSCHFLDSTEKIRQKRHGMYKCHNSLSSLGFLSYQTAEKTPKLWIDINRWCRVRVTHCSWGLLLISVVCEIHDTKVTVYHIQASLFSRFFNSTFPLFLLVRTVTSQNEGPGLAWTKRFLLFPISSQKPQNKHV